jgi:N-acetylglucosamine malate deacetylase 1
MRLDFSNERVLAVVAHPDDAELLCAGTLARARHEGAAIGICVLCQGDKGQPSTAVIDLVRVRGDEMRAAAAVISAELFCGGVPDSMLQDDPDTRQLLIGVLREFRPTLLLAHAPEDYHTDHRAASALAETCSWLCASRGQPVEGKPLEQPPEVWWMDTVGMHQFAPAFYVDISPFAELKQQMLACHHSQLARAGDTDFTPLQELLQNQMRARGQQAGVAAAEAFRAHHSFKRTRAW